MKNDLSKTWLTEPHIELEYKSYLVLAYLNELNGLFDQARVYPHLASLMENYRELKRLKEAADKQAEGFEKELAGFDFNGMKLNFMRMEKDPGLFEEILRVIDFTLPRFHKAIADGKALYDFIEHKMAIIPVGIQPLRKSEGYLLIRDMHKSAMRAYEYEVSRIGQPGGYFRVVGTQLVEEFSTSLSVTYHSIKINLVRNRPKLPNPAVFAVETEFSFPLEESTLPIAKRMLLKYVSDKE